MPSVKLDASIENSSYDNKSFSVASQDIEPTDFVFNNDYSKVWVLGSISDKIYQYTLSTAEDISTATYDNKSFDVASQLSNPTGFTFNNDYSKVWVLGSISDKIYQYTLSTAEDISTATYDNKSFSVASQLSNPRALAINNDFSKMWVVGFTNDTIYQYTLSTPGDITTATYDNKSLIVAAREQAPRALAFNNDYSKVWVVGSVSDKIHQYTLSTPGDITTATYDNKSFSVRSQLSNPTGFTFNNDYSKVWVLGSVSDKIHQYTVEIKFRITKHLVSEYKISGRAAKQVTSKYMIDRSIIKSLTSKYIIRNLVTNTAKVDVSTATYDSKSLSTSSQNNKPTGIIFNDDRSKMWLVFIDSRYIWQYTLSTPGDITTATYDNKRLDTTNIFSIQGLVFNEDYTSLFLISSTSDKIFQYDLSTAEDVSTGVRISEYSIQSQEAGPRGIAANKNLSKVWIVGSGQDTVFQYSLSTPGLLSTISYDNKSFDLSGQETFPQGITLNEDENMMWVLGSSSDSIHQYTLGTASDVTTASYDNLSYSFSGLSTNPTDAKFDDDFTSMYITAQNNNLVYQFALVSPTKKSRYTIAGRVKKSVTSKFKIVGRVAKQVISKYDIETFIVKSVTSRYQIRELTTKTFTSKYDIFGKVVKSLTSKFIITARVKKSVTAQYKITGRIAKSITSRYTILGKVAKSVTSKFSIRQLTSNTKIIFLSSASDDTITRVYGLSVDAENDYVYFTSETNSIIRYILSEFQNGVFTSKTIFPNPTDFGYGDSIVRDNNKTYLAFANTSTYAEIAVFNDNGVILTNEGFDILNINIAHFAITIKDGFLYLIGRSISESTKLIVEAYNISTKQKDAAKSYEITDAPNSQPVALALLDDTMYIKFYSFNNIYAYDIGSSVSDPDKIILGYNYYDETEPNQRVFGFSISDGKFYMINTIAQFKNQLLTFDIVKPLTSKYQIIARVIKSVTSKFKIAEIIEKSLASKYSILGKVAKSVTARYQIVNRVSKQLTSRYAIEGFITKSLTSQYKIVGKVAKSLTSKYIIRNLVTNSQKIIDVSTAVYDNKSYSIGEFTAPTGCTFNRDRSKVWITGKDALFIYQYSLSTPGDITTATYDNKRISVSAGTQGISFNADYTKMYLINSSLDTIIQYDLSTAEDISTATLVSSFSVAGQEAGPRGIAVNSDVSKIWIVGSGMRTVYQYSLSTPGNLTTATYGNKQFAVNAQATFPQGITFNETETKFWIADSSSDGIHQYSLSTPGDVSTASYDGLFYSLSGISTNPTDVKFNDDFTVMYVTGQHTNKIFQFAIPESIQVLTSQYSIVGRVLKSITSRFVIDNFVLKSLTSKYKIAGKVTKQLTSRYSIFGKVAKSLTSEYSIRDSITKSLTSRYEIIGEVRKIITSQYQIVGRVKKSVTSRYAIRNLTLKSLTSRYTIFGKVSKSITSRFSIRNLSLSSLTSRYIIVGKIRKTVISRYAIREITSMTLTSRYSIRDTIAKSLTSRYDILNKLSKSLTSKYTITGRTAKQVTSEYSIRNLTAKSLTSKYSIVGRVTKSLTSQYEILARVSKSLTSQYDIRESISKILSSEYSIVGRVIHAIKSRYYIGDVELPVSRELKLLTTVKSFKLLTPTKQTVRIKR